MRVAGAAALTLATILLPATVSGCAPQSESSAPTEDSGLVPQGPTVTGVQVERVIDGDTIKVRVADQDVTVRLVGINSPESVKPDWPVECFGPESSQYAKDALTGATVTLEFDPSQGQTDRYGRTLAYVWVEMPGGRRLFNRDAVADGMAVERQYGPTPYAWKREFQAAQARARAEGLGLWGACDRS